MGDDHEKVLVALDTAWKKFGAFALEEMASLPPIKNADKFVALLKKDVLIFIPTIRAFLNKHAAALEKKDITYFRHQAGEEYENVEVKAETTEKAFLFARVFASLLRDLENQ